METESSHKTVHANIYTCQFFNGLATKCLKTIRCGIPIYGLIGRMDDVIKKIKALNDRYPWCSDFEDIEIIVISAEGIYESYSELAEPISGPYVLSDENYTILTNVSDESDLEDKDFDPEQAPEMFNAGCNPGVSYFKWIETLPGDDDFHGWDEIFSEYADMLIENSDPSPWGDVNENYAQELYEAVNDAKQGYSGWHEVPDEERLSGS